VGRVVVRVREMKRPYFERLKRGEAIAMAGFDDYRHQVANFDGDLSSLLAEIRERADDPHRQMSLRFGFNESNPFHQQLYEIIAQFEHFLDGADPSMFDQIVQRLEEVVGLLEEAQGYDGGMNTVSIALSGWVAGAASNFRNTVITPFGRVASGQAKLAKELAITALGYKEILERARADCLDLAGQLKTKIAPEGTRFDFGTFLFIISAVASATGLGAATFAARLAWLAATSQIVVDGIAAAAPAPPGEVEREIVGNWALQFIPSAADQITQLRNHTLRQEGLIEEGLRADEDELDRADRGEVEFAKPELTRLRAVDDLGERDTAVHIDDIVKLKRVGVADLPAVAEMLHQAYLKMTTINSLFAQGYGDRYVIGEYGWRVRRVVDRLKDAITNARDYLYQSGVKLSEAADAYYAADTESAAELQSRIDAELADFTEPTYRPYQPTSPAGGDQSYF
jgi:hypothetical protein